MATSHKWVVEEDLKPMKGKPFFYARLTKSALAPHYIMVVPVDGQAVLPKAKVRVLLRCNKTSWLATYNGAAVQKRFDTPGWSGFANYNDLRVDDMVLFEVMGGDPLLLKVRVKRGEFPDEFVKSEKEEEGTMDDPIMVD